MKKNKPVATLRLLWHLVAFLPGLYLLNTIWWVAAANVAVVAELAGRAFFDLLQGEPAPWSIKQVLLVSAGGYLLRVIFTMVGSFVDAEHRFRIRTLLQQNVLRLIYRHPGAELFSLRSGEAVATIKEENDTFADVISWSIDTLGSLLSLAVALWLLSRIDILMAALVYGSLLIVATLATKLEKTVQQVREKAQEASANIGDNIADIFSAIQAVQVAGAEEPVMLHLQKLFSQRRHFQLRERVYSILLDALFLFNFTLVTSVILYFSASRLLVGSMTVGDLSLFINYLDILTDTSLEIGGALFKYTQSSVAFKRYGAMAQCDDYEELVHHDADNLYRQTMLSPSIATETIATPIESLRVCNLSHHYEQTDRGISDISFDLRLGSLTVVTGRIASGKTTLLRCLLGLVTPLEGTVFVNEIPVESLGGAMNFFTPPYAAYIPQIPVLLSGSLADNIALGEYYCTEEIMQAAKQAAFTVDLGQMEQGLQTQVGSRGLKLSGGQVQRVATARALIRDSELLICDDLSSALDQQTEEEIWRNVQSKKATRLIVSHRRAAFMAADNILVLENGKLEASGTWQELLQQSATFRSLWDASEAKEIN